MSKLNPIIEDGLLRVGDRLCKIAITEIVMHPVILTKDQHISKLILKQVHELAMVEETIFFLH